MTLSGNVTNTSDFWSSDEKRFSELSERSSIIKAEEKMSLWFGDEQGLEKFLILFFGRPNQIATNLAEKVASSIQNKYREFVKSEEDRLIIAEGMWGAISAGWAIAVVESIMDGWEPKQFLALDELLASSTSTYMEGARLIPPTDFEWYGYQNRKGITVFQWLLLPMGASSEDVGKIPAASELMEVGRWLMLYGISMGRAQKVLQSL